MKTNLSPMQRLRDQLCELLDRHDAEHHPGESCVEARLDALAYLAHSLGVKPEHLETIRQYLADYDATCPCRRSQRRFEAGKHPRGN